MNEHQKVLKDKEQLTEMYHVSYNHSISVSTERKTSNKTAWEQYVT